MLLSRVVCSLCVARCVLAGCVLIGVCCVLVLHGCLLLFWLLRDVCCWFCVMGRVSFVVCCMRFGV